MYFARRGSPGRRTASAYSPGSALRWIGTGRLYPVPEAPPARPATRGGKPRAQWRRVGNDPAVATTVSPTLDQVLAFCAQEPVERVFLEDIARRGLGRFSAVALDGRLESLCHVGANVVPSGVHCGFFADATARGQARMIIGEEDAVGELWDEVRERMPRPRDD